MTDSTSQTSATPSTSEPLFSAHYQVYINHTDAGGIVYHANHLVFFENCRRDWFTQLGLNTYFLQNEKGDIQHFVVSQADINYQQAILLDDRIIVQIDRVDLKPASLIFYQSICRMDVDGKTTVLSAAKIVIACVQNQTKDQSADLNRPAIRPIRVPKKLYDIIQSAQLQHRFTS